VLVWIPDPGLADAPSAGEGALGFELLTRDRLLLALNAVAFSHSSAAIGEEHQMAGRQSRSFGVVEPCSHLGDELRDVGMRFLVEAVAVVVPAALLKEHAGA
jgi:hypothetical protein